MSGVVRGTRKGETRSARVSEGERRARFATKRGVGRRRKGCPHSEIMAIPDENVAFSFFGHRTSRRRTLSPASVLNSARFASATTAVMAATPMNTEVSTRHGRSCDHREYFARISARARGVASFRSPRASPSPFHASRARGLGDSPGGADEAGITSDNLERCVRASRQVDACRAGGSVEPADGSPDAFNTDSARPKE